jgi:LemA protein
MNTRIEVFPSNIIASLFSFAPWEFFEIEDAGVRAAPSVEY